MKFSIAALLPLALYAKPTGPQFEPHGLNSLFDKGLKLVEGLSQDLENAGNQFIEENLPDFKAQAIDQIKNLAKEVVGQINVAEEADQNLAAEYGVNFETDVFKQLKKEVGNQKMVIKEQIAEVEVEVPSVEEISFY